MLIKHKFVIAVHTDYIFNNVFFIIEDYLILKKLRSKCIVDRTDITKIVPLQNKCFLLGFYIKSLKHLIKYDLTNQ